eukprot:CAMPEP_0177763180 /NCGR_PEP_ID=MMETSP0491_2-20121128/6735_1 /TAXON_ID=63592 /ORGANISM="Tetraselmis chuii, Strain PLY429" /LENGTH=542 /DNA_ID=CAMNT_0019279273 /DNA_START=314 /DNA_END=1942 /DNA_ORIENTATION=+
MTLAVLSTAVSRSLVYLVLCSSLFVGGSREPGFLQLPSRQPVAVADANKDPCTPKQVHLSLTADDSEMAVMWLTEANGCPSEVEYWAVGGNSEGSRQVDGSTDSYDAADMCSSPARSENFDPPNIHTALLTKLEAAREYRYSLGGGLYENSFFAPLRRGSTKPFSFVAYGDMGESVDKEAKSPLGQRVMDRVLSDLDGRKGSLILHMGDLSYAEGKAFVWDNFFEMIEPAAARVPYMIGVGNHEYDYTDGRARDPTGWKPYLPDWGNYDNGSGGECGVPTAKRFHMPGEEDPDAQSPFWYEFSYGTVHYIVVSSEHPMDDSSAQYAWLKAALKRVDRCVTPWLIVGFHRPMYVAHPHHGNTRVGKHLRREFEHLLSKHNVDVVINGHVHSYLRTCPIYNKDCVGRDYGGVVHLVIGTGGHKLSHISHHQGHWVESALVVPGYGRFDVDGANSLTFTFNNAETGEVDDSFTLEARSYLCSEDASRPASLDEAEEEEEEEDWQSDQWDWYFGAEDEYYEYEDYEGEIVDRPQLLHAATGGMATT